jgi:hypothetical protein
MRRITIALSIFSLLLIAPVLARHHRHHIVAPIAVPFFSFNLFAPAPMVPRHQFRDAGMVVAHPSGCPGTAFCGCGASIRVFGRSIPSLWLAANWFKFPRTNPAPGMVAVRMHHVMVLEADLGGGIWRVYDANSGGHATRIHGRSLAGYAIVNPHG